MQPRAGSQPKPNVSLCPACTVKITPGIQACPECGARICSHCYKLIPSWQATRCPNCGKPEILKKTGKGADSRPVMARDGSGFDTPSGLPCPRPQCTGKMVSRGGESLTCDTCGQISNCDEYRYLSNKTNPMFDSKGRQAAKDKIASEVLEPPVRILPSISQETSSDLTTGYEAKADEQKWWKREKIRRRRAKEIKPGNTRPARIRTNGEGYEFGRSLKKLGGILKALVLVILVGLSIFGIVKGVQWLGANLPFTNPITAVNPKPLLEFGGTNISDITQSSALIQFSTSEPAKASISYNTAGIPERHLDGQQALTEHLLELSGLEAGSTYSFRLDAVTMDGRKSSYDGSFNTLAAPDVTPPVISNIQISGLSDNEARISWQTDEHAICFIEYGKSSGYGQSIKPDSEAAQQHTYILKGLAPQTTYHLRITSTDAAENRSQSGDIEFSTLEEIKTGYAVGNRAPDFTLESLDGKSWTLSALRGRIVIVNFWRLSCGPCVAELPHFDTLNMSYSGQRPLDILTINLGDYATHLNNMIAEKGYSFNILLNGGQTASKYGISSIPVTFFIDESGIIQAVKRGKFNSPDEITEILNSF